MFPFRGRACRPTTRPSSNSSWEQLDRILPPVVSLRLVQFRPAQALVHEMLHIRQKGKGTAPSQRLARRASRELSNDELAEIGNAYSGPTPELFEEVLIQGLVKILARKRPGMSR